MKNIKDTLFDENGSEVFQYSDYGHWNTITSAGLRLCFKNKNPLRFSYRLVDFNLRWKINQKLENPVSNKTDHWTIINNAQKQLK